MSSVWKYLPVGMFVTVFIIGAYLWVTGDLMYVRRDVEETFGRGATSSILFVGDIMLDRHIRSIAEEKSYLHMFSCVKDILLAQTAVVGNLEGPITDNKSVSQGSRVGSAKNYQFTFDPQVTDALLLSNIAYVNLGNNHTLNFGWAGLEQTHKNLTKTGITYFGSPTTTQTVATSVAHINLPDRTLALVSYNEFYNPDVTTTSELILKEKDDGNFVVVYAHWGEEYATTSNKAEQELAHGFIESGADVVIGSHPHVVQEVEEYLGRPIFYSLGNFIFDQWFSDDVMRGMGVRISFNSTSTKAKFETVQFTLNKDGTTCPVIE